MRLRLTGAAFAALVLAGILTGLILVRAPGPASATGIVALDAGGSHNCALNSAGGVRCWGLNVAGALGDGTFVTRTRPVNTIGLAGGVTAVGGGGEHTCALLSSGGVKCWGHNFFGQVGDGSVTHRPAPVDVSGLSSGVVAVVPGFFHTCALTSAGGVKCWGTNSNGQIGDGTFNNLRPTPTDVVGLSSGVLAIGGGDLHTCALLSTGGVKCWGWNFYGQLGDGTNTDRSTPVDVVGLSDAVDIMSGIDHNCVVTATGATKCWGYNLDGQVGDGTTVDRTTPVDVAGLGGTPSAMAGGGAHSCALVGGTLKCWGRNNVGQVGDGTSGNIRTAPTEVAGLPAGGSAVTAGGEHTCALAGGNVYCWGRNAEGQLGVGTTANSPSPVAVTDAKPPTPTATRTPTNTPTPTATPTPKQPFGDTDGDTIPNEDDPDDDGDGCSDVAELGTNPTAGGGRNPHVFWDFFDTPDMANVRDRSISVTDIVRVVGRFGSSRGSTPTKAEALAEALAPPTPAPAYHAAFDRSSVFIAMGVPPASGPPNGSITVGDVMLAVGQFGHSCGSS